LEKFDQILISQVTQHPLAPNDVVSSSLWCKILKALKQKIVIIVSPNKFDKNHKTFTLKFAISIDTNDDTQFM
jgi:hypothetical protein